MDTERLAGDERPLEVGAEDARADAVDRDLAQARRADPPPGAVMIVGWNAVTPVSSMASPARL